MSRDWTRRALLRTGGAALAGGAIPAVQGRARNSIQRSGEPPGVGWQRAYSDLDATAVRAVSRTEDGYVLLCRLAEAGEPPVLVRTTADGRPDRVEAVTAGNAESAEPVDLVARGDGGYVVLAQTATSGGRQALLYGLSSLDEVGWTRRVGPEDADFQPRSVASDGDGVVVTGGIVNDTLDIDTHVARVGADGSVAWERTLSPQRVTAGISILAEDEGYSVAGGTAETPEDLTAGTPPVEGWLARLGPEGDIEWQRQYATSTPDGTTNAQTLFSDHVRTDDGYLLVGGAATERNGTETARILAAPADGDRTWDYRYDGDGASAFRAVERAGDAYYVAGRVGEQSAEDARGLAVAVSASSPMLWDDQTSQGASTVAGLGAEIGGDQPADVQRRSPVRWNQRLSHEGGGRFLDVAAGPDGPGVYAGTANVSAGTPDAWLVGLGESDGSGGGGTATPAPTTGADRTPSGTAGDGPSTPTRTPTTGGGFPTPTRPAETTPVPDEGDRERSAGDGGPPSTVLGGLAVGGLFVAGLGLLRFRGGGDGGTSGDGPAAAGGTGSGTAAGGATASGDGDAAGDGTADGAAGDEPVDGAAAGRSSGDLLSAATAVATDGAVERHAATLADGSEAELSVLAEEHAADEAVAAAFEEAGRQWNGISQNPHVATVYETGDDPRPWVAFDAGDGALETLVDDLDREERIDVLRDAAEAIRTAGMYNVVHGAVEPRTVYVGADGATLADWGIARDVARELDDRRVTPYTAPEQLGDEGGAGVHTDVYRLGALAYRLLTGAPPYPPQSDLAAAIEDAARTPPSEVGSVSRALEDVVETAMAADPAERYDSAYEFRAALNGAVDS